MSRAKYTLKTIIAASIYFSGFNWLYTRINTKKRNIPIVFYHEIGNNVNDGLGEFSVTVDHFERQMQWLSRHFHVVSIDKLVEHIKGKIELPGKLAAVTFDGGYVGNYQHAFPILKKYNVPATIYITTSYIDGNISWERKLLFLISFTKEGHYVFLHNGQQRCLELKTRRQKLIAKQMIQNHMSKLNDEEKNNLLEQLSNDLGVQPSGISRKLFLSWDQIREMNQHPLVTIGSHSLTHPRLTNVSIEDVRKEIRGSKIQIEGKLGGGITSFCYPDGYYSEEIKKVVKNAGYSSALAVSTRGILSDLNKFGDDVFELRRLYVPNRSFAPLLAVESSGLIRSIKKVGKSVLGYGTNGTI